MDLTKHMYTNVEESNLNKISLVFLLKTRLILKQDTGDLRVRKNYDTRISSTAVDCPSWPFVWWQNVLFLEILENFLHSAEKLQISIYVQRKTFQLVYTICELLGMVFWGWKIQRKLFILLTIIDSDVWINLQTWLINKLSDYYKRLWTPFWSTLFQIVVKFISEHYILLQFYEML